MAGSHLALSSTLENILEKRRKRRIFLIKWNILQLSTLSIRDPIWNLFAKQKAPTWTLNFVALLRLFHLTKITTCIRTLELLRTIDRWLQQLHRKSCTPTNLRVLERISLYSHLSYKNFDRLQLSLCCQIQRRSGHICQHVLHRTQGHLLHFLLQ